MAAPIGNKFWEKRATHGKGKIFKSPESMWEAACQYFEYCEANPLKYEEVHAGRRIKVSKVQAFTIIGLCTFWGVNKQYLDDFEESCNEDFKEVIRNIRDIIYQHKFIHAAAGGLNPMIIARDLALREKAQIDATTNGESLNKTPTSGLTFEQLMVLKYGKENTDNSGD